MAFQSTRPRGARLIRSLPHLKTQTRFNPRARGGRDFGVPYSLLSETKFQSTRPRGARPSSARCSRIAFCVSIHAPAGGATAHATKFVESLEGFNPRARGGRDTACAS